MIELLVVALLQATDPQTAPSSAPPAETTTEAPAPEATESIEVTGEPERPGRRCEQVAPTGSRVRSRRTTTCTTQDSRDSTAETARRIANSGGAAGQSGEAIGRGQ
jgi:hypothetical protein